MLRLVLAFSLVSPAITYAQTATYGAADLERDVRTRMSAFRACKRDRELVGERPRGAVRVGVTVRPDGSIFPAVVEQDGTGNSLFTGCVLAVFRDVRTAARLASPQRFTFVVTVDASDLRLGEFVPGASTRPLERTIEGHITAQSPTQTSGSSGATFDSSVVSAALIRASAAIRRCYENELINQPTLSGRVTVEFTIEVSGRVTNAQTPINDTGSQALGECVRDVVGSMEFNPGPVGGSVRYRYPFVFSPERTPPPQGAPAPLPEVRADAALLRTPAFARCEQEARALDPALEDTVFVTVAVDPAGRIAEAVANPNDERHRGLGLCLERAVRTLAFARSESGVVTRFRYRFDFARVAR